MTSLEYDCTYRMSSIQMEQYVINVDVTVQKKAGLIKNNVFVVFPCFISLFMFTDSVASSII